MQAITELIVRAAELAEAEGRVLRVMTLRVAVAVGMILLGVAASAAGLVLLLAAIYLAVAERSSPAAGAAIAGVAAVSFGFIAIWGGRRAGD